MLDVYIYNFNFKPKFPLALKTKFVYPVCRIVKKKEAAKRRLLYALGGT
jgi:hypothetical protein